MASIPGVDRAAHDLVVLFSRLRRRIVDEAPWDKVTPSQRSVLSRLSKNGPATIGELATVERVRSQSMAATVQALEDEELLERSLDPDDGRRRILRLTAKGAQFVDARRSAARSWLTEALATTCTADELATVEEAIAILDRVVDA
jgi:DNA-binding MarR family transcriptional regulator